MALDHFLTLSWTALAAYDFLVFFLYPVSVELRVKVGRILSFLVSLGPSKMVLPLRRGANFVIFAFLFVSVLVLDFLCSLRCLWDRSWAPRGGRKGSSGDHFWPKKGRHFRGDPLWGTFGLQADPKTSPRGPLGPILGPPGGLKRAFGGEFSVRRGLTLSEIPIFGNNVSARTKHGARCLQKGRKGISSERVGAERGRSFAGSLSSTFMRNV